MTGSTPAASLEDALVFPFRDREWQNRFLVGSLVMLSSFVVPILPLFLVYGYAVQIVRRIIKGDGEPHLPAWDNWSALLVDGVKVFAIGLIYTLPVIVLFVGMGLFMGGSIVPAVIAESAGEKGAPLADTVAILGVLLGMAGGFAAFGMGMVLSLAIGVCLPAAIGHIVATGQFGAAFRVREWWPIFRANVGGYLLILAISFGLSMAISIVIQVMLFTVCLSCLAPLLMAPVSFYLTLVTYALYGRAYRVGTENLAAQEGA